MYKLGDEVLVKAKIIGIDEFPTDGLPYEVETEHHFDGWVSENEIINGIDGKTYIQGLSDAWELARKILMKEYGYTAQQIYDIFGDGAHQTIRNLTPQEALAKIEAYEGEQEIKVGDVVKRAENGCNGVVTSIHTHESYVMWEDGSTCLWKTKHLKKTGKHIDIEGLLRQIGE